MTKKIIAAALAALMVFALVGCTAPSGSQATTPPAATTAPAATAAPTDAPATAEPADLSVVDPVAPTACLERVLAADAQTVTMYPAGNKYSGVMDDPIGDWLLDNLNVKLEIWANSSEKTQTILASGDLPDIMTISAVENLEAAIDGKLIQNLEGYLNQDYLSNIIASDILMTAINYSRQYRSSGTGDLYAIPGNIGPGSLSTVDCSRYRIVVNWPYFYDLYKDSGLPTVDTVYDVIDVMKELMAAYPTDDAGNKLWGTALYYDTGASVGIMANYYFLFGYNTSQLGFFLESNDVTGEYRSIFADDALYYEACKWFNTMYREGVMDPDSINKDRGSVRGGPDYYFMGMPSVNVESDHFLTLYIGEQYSVYTSGNKYGNNNFITLSAKTDKADAALVFLNFLSTGYGALVMSNGPQGQFWDIDENGDFYATAAFKQDDGGNRYWSDGTTFIDPGLNGIANNGVPIGDTVYFSDMTKWQSVERSAKSDVQNQWTEMYGYDYTTDLLLDKNQLSYDSAVTGHTSFVSAPDDVQALVISSCQDAIREYTWKMIYATTDAEFDGFWNQMKSECEELGVQSIIDWRLEDLANAAQIVASLG